MYGHITSKWTTAKLPSMASKDHQSPHTFGCTLSTPPCSPHFSKDLAGLISCMFFRVFCGELVALVTLAFLTIASSDVNRRIRHFSTRLERVEKLKALRAPWAWEITAVKGKFWRGSTVLGSSCLFNSQKWSDWFYCPATHHRYWVCKEH